jgi:type IV secretory pathway VirD2 relaxase
MPVSVEAIEELMEREGFSLRDLSNALSSEKVNRLAKKRGIIMKDEISYETIRTWIYGIHSTRINNVDRLYLYAELRGHEDLNFYYVP